MTLSPGGPLQAHIPAFNEALVVQGYASDTIYRKTRLLHELDGWLLRHGLQIEDFSKNDIEEFIRYRKDKDEARGGDLSTLMALLRHLVGSGIVSVKTSPDNDSPLDRLQATFNQHLLDERGLQSATRDWYLCETRRFLLDRFPHGPLLLGSIASRDVTQFILKRTNSCSARSVQKTGTALRSLFRFLLQRREIATNLAAAIPRIANWSSTGLPKYLAASEVETVLKGCDQETPEGRRSKAMLLLLARLGLRAGEVVRLKLSDINWDAGEVLIYGKGGRHDRLPLPVDVGEALTSYIRHDRPVSSSRQVFLRLAAPHRGLAGPSSLGYVVRRSLKRAGLNPAFKGTHLFRHSLATRMLQCGASLEEIGRILRHESPTTTAIYAKADLQALRALALPWPGGEA